LYITGVTSREDGGADQSADDDPAERRVERRALQRQRQQPADGGQRQYCGLSPVGSSRSFYRNSVVCTILKEHAGALDV
jgi:hypothetical protein